MQSKILKHFTNHEKMLSNYLIIIIILKLINFRERLKIVTPKQIHQRLPIVLAQVKARNSSEN